jgi:hypothetical protein
LRDVLLAVQIKLGMASCVAATIDLERPRGPVRIVILLLKLGQFGDDFDPGHWRILR